MDADRPKTTDIEVGCYYGTDYVGRLFGRSGEWARKWAKAGRFAGAKKLTGGKSWIIPGAAVLALVGEEQRERDRLAAATATAAPTKAERKRIAADVLKDLARLKAETRHPTQ